MKLRFQIEDRRYRVLAFGETLNAGMHHYAEGIECDQILCDYIGSLHCTTNEMIQGNFLSSILNDAARFYQYDLVIILGGTNELEFCHAETISYNIWILHQCAHVRGIPTLALGIPVRGHLPDLRERTDFINQLLAITCARAGDVRSTYIDFPIPFSPYNEAGYWSFDGFYMSTSGCEALRKMPTTSCFDPPHIDTKI